MQKGLEPFGTGFVCDKGRVLLVLEVDDGTGDDEAFQNLFFRIRLVVLPSTVLAGAARPRQRRHFVYSHSRRRQHGVLGRLSSNDGDILSSSKYGGFRSAGDRECYHTLFVFRFVRRKPTPWSTKFFCGTMSTDGRY